MTFLDFLRMLYDRELPANETLWHRWTLIFPRWLDGELTTDVWRRSGPRGWEYKKRDETPEELNARQW